MVPKAGLEPARRCRPGILSPVRLPIPPLRLLGYLLIIKWHQPLVKKLGQAAPHQNAHRRSHHQPPRPSAGISQAVQPLDIRIKILVHFHAIAVKLELG